MADISRQQLKKNELEEFVLIAATWIKNNRSMFLSIAGTSLGVLLFTAFVLVRFHTAKTYAIDKLAMAQGQLFQGQADQANKSLDEIINQYSSSDIAVQSRLSKAEFYCSQQNYQEAERVLLPLADKDKPKHLIPLALASLGAARENSMKFADALSTYNLFIEKFPDHFLAPKIYESMARVYELTNAPAQAKSVYEKMVTLYPSSGWSARAQERLNALANIPAPASSPSPESLKK